MRILIEVPVRYVRFGSSDDRLIRLSKGSSIFFFGGDQSSAQEFRLLKELKS